MNRIILRSVLVSSSRVGDGSAVLYIIFKGHEMPLLKKKYLVFQLELINLHLSTNNIFSFHLQSSRYGRLL